MVSDRTPVPDAPVRLRPLLRFAPALLLATLLTACAGTADPALSPTVSAPTPPPRLVVVSWDGAGDRIVDDLLARGALPHLVALRERGAAAAWSVPAFPSKTAISHATLWTGAWPSTHGVVANSVPLLPAADHDILASRRGFSSEVLAAEPLWMTAALAGRSVVILSATQSYPPTPWVDALEAERQRRGAEGPPVGTLRTVSGFEHRIAPGRLIDHRDLAPVDPTPTALAGGDGPAGWGGLPPGAHLDGAREARLTVGDSRFFVLFFDADPDRPGLDTALVRQGGREATAGRSEALLRPREASLEAARLDGDFSAWSPPFVVGPAIDGDDNDDGATTLGVNGEPLLGQVLFRLFDLAPDGSSVALYQRAVHALDGTLAGDELAAYRRAYPGFHDDPFWLYGRGGLGPTLPRGGDGTAEARALEIVAQDLSFTASGSRFALATWGPDLLFHYTPMSDSAGHAWAGILDPELPGHDPQLAAHIEPFHRRVFELQDAWLGELVAATDEAIDDDRGTVLALVSDHGMAGVHSIVDLNRALAGGGLQARRRGDDAGGARGPAAIDLAATRSLAPPWTTFGVCLNDQERPGGVVPAASATDELDGRLRAAALERTEAVLLALRQPPAPGVGGGSGGGPVVRRVFRAGEAPGLGYGGERACELIVDLAPGWYPRSLDDDELFTTNPRILAELEAVTPGFSAYGPTRDGLPEGQHGFWPERRDMHAIFYLAGPGVVRGRTLPAVRHVDVAPTLARLLGLPAPADADGRVIFEALENEALNNAVLENKALKNEALENDATADNAPDRRAIMDRP